MPKPASSICTTAVRFPATAVLRAAAGIRFPAATVRIPATAAAIVLRSASSVREKLRRRTKAAIRRSTSTGGSRTSPAVRIRSRFSSE